MLFILFITFYNSETTAKIHEIIYMYYVNHFVSKSKKIHPFYIPVLFIKFLMPDIEIKA